MGRGIAIGLGWSVLGVFVTGLLGGLTAGIALVLLLGIGIVQAAWIIPVWRYYRRIGETETAKGILVTASVVFLLNAGCWGFVASLGSSSFH